MKKTDSLLKKAALFEKLAIYGDRRSFLNALAQETSHPGDLEEAAAEIHDVVQPLFMEAFRLVAGVGGDFSSLQDAWQAKKDPAALAHAVEMASVQVGASLGPDKAAQLRGLAAKIRAASGQTRSLGPSTAPVASVKTYKPIPRETQNRLSELNVTKGWGLPLKIDGDIGPETRAALNSFKSRMGIPYATDQEIFSKIESVWSDEHPTNLDDAEKQQNYSATHPAESAGLKI